MNLFEIPSSAEMRAFAGMPVLRHWIAQRLIHERLANDATECVIKLRYFDNITDDMIEAVAAEMREKGYTVVVKGDELAVTWDEDLLG